MIGDGNLPNYCLKFYRNPCSRNPKEGHNKFLIQIFHVFLFFKGDLNETTNEDTNSVDWDRGDVENIAQKNKIRIPYPEIVKTRMNKMIFVNFHQITKM